MLAVERRRLIAESVRSRGVISVAEMAEALGTTEITLRRDLRAMAKDGLLVRTHGGAIQPAGFGHEPSYSEKARQAAVEKGAIARLALEMIRPGDSIVLGPGTTTLALARLLVQCPELTVVTNSLLVAQALMDAPRVEVILTGGTLRRSIHALVGPATEESVRALRASQAFISGNGFTAARGLSTPSPVVAATDRTGSHVDHGLAGGTRGARRHTRCWGRGARRRRERACREQARDCVIAGPAHRPHAEAPSALRSRIPP
jgi:DeoR/GlpR family transcriptional regulator of sugar metabolism